MNDQCDCHNNDVTYKIIENYRSIVNRKQPVVCSWKVVDRDGKSNFSCGTKCRKHSDALVIRSNYYCLINPWYKYTDIHEYILLVIKQNSKFNSVLEIVLLECSCSLPSHEYDFAIVQCPCLEQLKTYCIYCQFLLVETNHPIAKCSKYLFKDITQQTNISLFNNADHSNDDQHNKMHDDFLRNQHKTITQVRIKSNKIPYAAYNDHTNTSAAVADYEVRKCSTTTSISNGSSISTLSLPCLSQKDSFKDALGIVYLKNSLSTQNFMKSNENLLFNDNGIKALTQFRTQAIQTKLFAILLPFSPLSEMNDADIEAKSSRNVTRTCQVNTLSYLIKDNDNFMEKTDSSNSSIIKKLLDSTPSMIFTDSDGQITQDLLSQEKPLLNDTLSVTLQHGAAADSKQFHSCSHKSLVDLEPDIPFNNFAIEQTTASSISHKAPLILKDEHPDGSILIPSPLKCINVCNTFDFDDPQISMISVLKNTCNSTCIYSSKKDQNNIQVIDITNPKQDNAKLKIYNPSFKNSNPTITKQSIDNYSKKETSSQKQNLSTVHHHASINDSDIAGCTHRSRRNTSSMRSTSRLVYCREKYDNISEKYDKIRTPSDSSLRVPKQNQHDPTRFTQNRLSNQQEQPICDKPTSNSNVTYQFKLHDHIINARATKNSIACERLQTLLKNPDSCLEEFLDSQLQLTCNKNHRSLCILVDDNKESQQYRSLFLQHIYETLSNSLKRILKSTSLKLTCMNLAFFNNALCDIVNMARLRLIDTGKNILLLPSCELVLQTADDINIATHRLNANMSFAHQIFIVNFFSQCSSVSGSFLFLQLAPISCTQSKGLLTNLNSTTYSVLNLIRQLDTGQLLDHNQVKRYLLNDYVLNRLLKSYILSSNQTTTVLSTKPKVQ